MIYDQDIQEQQNGQGIERSSSMIPSLNPVELTDLNNHMRWNSLSRSNNDANANPIDSNSENDSEADEKKDVSWNDSQYDSMNPLSKASQLTEHKNLLFRSISNTDINALDLILKQLDDSIDITEVINQENGYSLLHLAVFKDSDYIVHSLWKHVMTRTTEMFQNKKSKLQKWINQKSRGKEGFTCMHLAAFNGNLSIVRFLERHGADIYAENNYSLNMLHVASQGNQPSTIVYFIEKHIDINSIDRVRSTPLHWACYAGAENAVSYLIAYGADPNLQDDDGYTWLHLAVKSAEAIKSTRIVKQLLFWGGDRNIFNRDGYKPVDYVKSISVHHIGTEIKKSLAEPKYCSCLLLSQPLTKMKREPYTASYFVFLILLSLFLIIFFISPVINSIRWIVVTLLSYGLTMIFWAISTFRDPGYLQKSEKISFITLVERFEAGWLWPKCHVIRTPRSRHCNICDKWVERFDHHCPWINNWIGTRNHGAFMIFLIVTYIMLVLVILELALNFNAVTYYDSQQVEYQYIGFWIPEKLVTNAVIYKGICSTILIGCAFFWLLMNILLFTQILNFMSNQTMNERYGNKARRNNDYERSFFENDNQAALLRNASIDSTLETRNSSRCKNFLKMMKGSNSKDQYKLFMESMKRAGSSLFQSVLNNKNFY